MTDNEIARSAGKGSYRMIIQDVFKSVAFLIPLSNLLLSLAWITVILASTLGIGRWISARFDLVQEDSQYSFTPLILQTVLGVGIVSQLIFIAAWAGIFGWPFVLSLLGIGGALLFRTKVWSTIHHSIASLNEIRSQLLPVFALALIPLAFCLVPEYHFDALRTHLWLTRRIATTGHLPVDLQNWNLFIPNSAACWFSPAYLLTGETGAKMAHWILGCLTATLLIGGFNHHGRPSRVGCLAADLFLVVPVIAWEMSTTYVDLAQTLFLTGAMIALVQHLETKSFTLDRLGALFAGAAIASKYNALLWLPFWLVMVTLDGWRRKMRFIPITFAAGRFLLLALLVTMPWLIRNWTVTGNPLYPIPIPLFSASSLNTELIEAVRSEQSSFGCGHDAAAFLLLPVHLVLTPARFRGSPGVMPFLAVGVLLSLWWRLTRSDRLLLAAFFFGLFSWFWIGQEIRYFLPVLPIAAWLSVRPLQLVSNKLFRAIWVSIVLLQICLHLPWVYNRLPFDVPYRLTWTQADIRVMTGAISKVEYLERTQPFFPVYRWANRHLPASARILSFDASAYWSDRPLLYALSPIGELTLERDPDRLVDRCHQSGLTHVVVNMNWLTPDIDRSKVSLFFLPVFQQRHLILLYKKGNVCLFSIP